MSIALMTAAFKTTLPLARKMVLLALCDNANDQGECFPSVSMLAGKCSMSERGIQTAISRLQADGYIKRDFRKGRSTVYLIANPAEWTAATPALDAPHPRTTCTPASDAPPQEVHPTPAPDAPPPPQEVHPTPARRAPITIKEPSIEPSGNHQARAQQESMDTFALPDWIPVEAWNGYLDMRREKKKVPTDRARDLVIKELAKLRDKGQDIEAVLNKSTINGWTDVFPLKDDISVAGGETLRTFIDRCKAEGQRALPEGDPIFEYAPAVGLPEDAVLIAWFKFKERYLNSRDRQTDWRDHFRKAVKDNWFKLWYLRDDGTSGWTTAGQQASREFDARQKAAA